LHFRRWRKGFTDKYLKGFGKLRAFSPNGHLKLEEVSVAKVQSKLNEIAEQRNQSLAQMALAWLLKINELRQF
jgi:L-glyceraldehyde 3-phosphate reductase